MLGVQLLRRFKTVIVPIQGTVTANAGANLNTSTLALESGGNLAAAKADLDTIVTNTNKIPASPATEGGHLAAIDTATAASKTDLDTIVTNTNKYQHPLLQKVVILLQSIQVQQLQRPISTRLQVLFLQAKRQSKQRQMILSIWLH